MRKLYEALSVDVVKFEAQDVITASGALPTQTPNDPPTQGGDATQGGGTQGGGPTQGGDYETPTSSNTPGSADL